MSEEADYELMLLLDASIPEDERRDVVNNVERELIDLDVEIVNSEQYDVRQIAYPIEGATRGHYHLFEINVPAGQHDELQERVNLVENVIRYLFVRKREQPEVFEEDEDSEEEAKETAEAEEEPESTEEEEEAPEPATETTGG